VAAHETRWNGNWWRRWAQAQAAYLHWLETLTTWTGLEPVEDQAKRDDGNMAFAAGWQSRSDRPGFSNGKTLFHRIMMRTLRTLREPAPVCA
jgi:hypothetical protein